VSDNLESLKEYHLGEIRKHKESAEAILNAAEKEHRDNTEDEMAESRMHMTRISEHTDEVDRIVHQQERRAQLEALGSVTSIAVSEPSAVEARSPGEAFVASNEYQALMEAARSGGLPQFNIPSIELQAVVGDTVRESTSSNAIVPQWQDFLTAPGLVPFPTRIAQILNVVNLDQGNTAYWPKVTTRAISDLTDQAETENKSPTDFVFGQASAALLKWTAFAAVSEEMFQDAQILVNYVNTQLGTMALQKEEKGIAVALYTGSVTAAFGYQVNTAPNGFDKVLEAMTIIRNAGGVPDFILINPMDYAVLQALRWTNGGYFSGGPYQGPPGGLWGVPGFQEIITTSAPRGTPLVGSTAGCILFRKGGLRVEASNSHGNFFQQNIIAIRSEIRSVLGILYPEWFVECNFGS
jgi:HK97 family phage major capsid protein